MSTRFKLLGLAAIAVLTAAVVWTAATQPFGRTNPDQSAFPTLDLPSPSATLPPGPAVASYPGQALGPTAPPAPTGDRAQSKLWVAEGSWWSVMLEPLTHAYHVFELVEGGKSWRDSGTVIDDRPLSQADCLWDGTHLYVASGVRTASASGAALLSRYSFDPKARQYLLDPNFPVPITPAGVDSIVLTKDTTGKLWTAYIAEDGQVTINRTLGNDLFWGAPMPLPVDHSLVTKDDVATVLDFGPGRVGVMWSSRADGSFYLSSHEDGDPDETWSAPEVALAGRDLASGELKAIAGPDGRLFAAVKTSVDDDPSSNGRAPQVLLLTRAVAGTWTSVLYSRLQDQHASPAIQLDQAAGIVYVLATTPKRGGTINFKRTLADAPTFPTGLGEPFITDPTSTTIGRATSTKDPVAPETGLVFLAYDPVTFRYLHGVMDLGAGVAAGTMPADVPGARPPVVFLDTFDPWPIGSSPSTGWKLRPNDPPGAFTIVGRPTPTDRSASIAAPSAGRDVQACKSFPDASAGDVKVDLRIRLGRVGATDGVITEVRGSDVESASVRFGRSGFFAYFRGATKIITLIPIRAGAWYHSVVVVHIAAKTYDWSLSNARGKLVLRVRGIAWRHRSPAPLDKVCVRTPTGGRGVVLDWDDVSVIR
jgi:hypothetical protein